MTTAIPAPRALDTEVSYPRTIRPALGGGAPITVAPRLANEFTVTSSESGIVWLAEDGLWGAAADAGPVLEGFTTLGHAARWIAAGAPRATVAGLL